MDAISLAVQRAKADSAGTPAERFWKEVNRQVEVFKNKPAGPAPDGIPSGPNENPIEREWLWGVTRDSWTHGTTAGKVSEIPIKLFCERYVQGVMELCDSKGIAAELEARRQRGIAIQEAASLEQKKRRILIETRSERVGGPMTGKTEQAYTAIRDSLDTEVEKLTPDEYKDVLEELSADIEARLEMEEL